MSLTRKNKWQRDEAPSKTAGEKGYIKGEWDAQARSTKSWLERRCVRGKARGSSAELAPSLTQKTVDG